MEDWDQITQNYDHHYINQQYVPTGSELFDMFANDVTTGLIAQVGVTDDVVAQIHEMRQDEPDDWELTDREIAEAIVVYARGCER